MFGIKRLIDERDRFLKLLASSNERISMMELKLGLSDEDKAMNLEKIQELSAQINYLKNIKEAQMQQFPNMGGECKQTMFSASLTELNNQFESLKDRTHLLINRLDPVLNPAQIPINPNKLKGELPAKPSLIREIDSMSILLMGLRESVDDAINRLEI